MNYWLWPTTWGDTIDGTDADIAALAPRFLRIGGHNNDNNMPDRLDGPALAAAVAYAKAVGPSRSCRCRCWPTPGGVVPGAADAAALVTLANVTGGHGIKYFSIGNEPDLYPDQEATLKTYTPADYCAQVMAFVPAMKAVDPTIQIIGPDLSWKYLPGNDWLTPILTGCGAAFDVIAVHRYPFAPEASTRSPAPKQDAAQFSATITRLRALMTAAGVGDKPLAITETNITYDGMPGKEHPGRVAGDAGRPGCGRLTSSARRAPVICGRRCTGASARAGRWVSSRPPRASSAPRTMPCACGRSTRGPTMPSAPAPDWRPCVRGTCGGEGGDGGDGGELEPRARRR